MKLSNISVSYIQHCGDDLSVANAARVSFHKESEWEQYMWIDPPTGETVESANAKGYPVRHVTQQRLSEKDVKLISYLAKHKHFSPFNHSFITVRVKAPIFVARQLVKHKFMPWNEVSRRYVDDEPEFYFPKYWRERAKNVKQGSSENRCEAMYINSDKDWLHEDIVMPLDDQVNLLMCNQVLLYNEMIDADVSPEQARMILPQNMMTEWWWSGTLGAYCDMLRLRLDSHTQKETQDVAQQVRHIIEPLFPVSVKALLGET